MRGLALVQSKVRKCSERALWPNHLGHIACFEFGRGWGRVWERKGLLVGLTCDINMDSLIQKLSLSQHFLGSCWQSIVNKSLGTLIRAGGRGQGPRLSSAFPQDQTVNRSWACDFLLYFENSQSFFWSEGSKALTSSAPPLNLSHPWESFWEWS